MKQVRKLVYVFFISPLFLFACGGENKNEVLPEYSDAVGAYEEYEGTFENGDSQMASENNFNGDSHNDELDEQMLLDRKLIKNATLSFKTDSLAIRKRIINNAVNEFGAYVEHEEQYNASFEETVTTIIRVPSTNFDPFIEAITIGIGSFDSKSIEVDDVTEEYVDVEARINTKKELKKRFIALLDKAETITKIMEVEREINALQAEIESYEGRLKYLASSVRYATVNLTYYRSIDVPVAPDNRFEAAFANGWNGTVLFFVGLANIWPLVLIIACVLLVLRFRMRRDKSIKISK